jgi:hypothetical protein
MLPLVHLMDYCASDLASGVFIPLVLAVARASELPAGEGNA